MRKKKKKIEKKPAPTKAKSVRSTSIVAPAPAPTIIQGKRERALTNDEVSLLKRTVAKGCDNDEFALFLWVCRKHKVDPLTRQIYAIVRWESKHHEEEKIGEGGKTFKVWVGGNKMTIQMGVDGYRSLAARNHKDYGNCEDPVFEWFEPKRYVDPGNKRKEIPSKATINFWKRGADRPTTGSVRWDEFAPADLDGSTAFFWKKMPTHMLAKCAEVLALRKAYPDMADIYVTEEMAQAQDHTPEGRQIVDEGGFAPSGRPVTFAADRALAHSKQADVAKNVIAEKTEQISELQKMRAEGTYCEKHRGHISKCPADDHTQAELEAFDAIEAKIKKAKQSAAQAAAPESEKPPIDVKPEPPKSEELIGGGKPVGRLEVDCTVDPPILRGDLQIADALERMKPHLKALEWKDEWWRIGAEDIHIVAAFAKQCNFTLDLIPNKDAPKKTAKPKDESQTVKGKVVDVSEVKETHAGGKFVMLTIGRTKYTSWSKSSIPWITEFAQGRDCEFFIDKRHAITGIVRMGKTTFRDNNPVGEIR